MGSDISKEYEKFEDIPGYKDLPPFPKGDVIFPYGMKVVERDGKQIWQAASEQDYRESIAEIKGIKPEDVGAVPGCHLVMQGNGNPRCIVDAGACPGGCVPRMNIHRHWFCLCRD